MTELIEDTEIMPFEANDDPNHRRHVVRPVENAHLDPDGTLSAQDLIDLARLTGTEVVAVCGYRWVPKANPANHATCEPCLNEVERILAGDRR